MVRDRPEDLAFSVALDDAIHSNLFSHVLKRFRQNSLQCGGSTLYQSLGDAFTRGLFENASSGPIRNQCAVCRLRHTELLDAAHIIPDSEPEGEPVVNNGISLCRLHHAAFDRYFLAVWPDHVIEIRSDILEESDGPTLWHAIQGLHGMPDILPNALQDRPSQEFLVRRYDQVR